MINSRVGFQVSTVLSIHLVFKMMKFAVLLVLMSVCLARDIRSRDAIIFEITDDDVSSEYDDVDKYNTLVYPGDCKTKVLKNEATKCGLDVEKGAKHWKIMDPKTNQLLTLIAFTEKQNDACRDTIKKLNERCD